MDDVSTHRTRTNRWPTPTGHDGHGAPLYPWQQDAPAPNATGYEALEDRD